MTTKTDAARATSAVPAANSANRSASESNLSLVVVQLMKGVVYRDSHPDAWNQLRKLAPQVRDYAGVMGLTVTVDEAEGYAFLRSTPETDEGSPIPRLIARRSLSFHLSLLLALLRKRLAEHDATDSDTRLVLTRNQLVEMIRVFMPDTSNDARLVDQVDTQIRKAANELGFLRPVKNQDATYEVRRILKAFVDGQWLADFDQRLADYCGQLTGEADTSTGSGRDASSGGMPDEDEGDE